MSVRCSLVVLVLGAGCVSGGGDETSTTWQPSRGDDCTTWGCGTNSPVIDALGFHELSERGERNAEGFAIDSFRKPGAAHAPYRIDVVDGELYARPSSDASPTLTGAALIGMQLRVVNASEQRAYRIRIADVGTTWLWATREGVRARTSTYKLEWLDERTGSNGAWTNLCAGAAREPGVDAHFSVLFDDDRIDADRKAVTAQTAGWFNIGCAGHALAKQYLAGHTKASSARLGITTTLAQRTAHLKMLVGDYCGSGEPFTVAGEALAWRDALGLYDSIATAPAAIEARWTERGAACLNTPRVDWNGTTDRFGASVEDEIAASCARPPACGSTDPRDLEGAHVVSAFNE